MNSKSTLVLTLALGASLCGNFARAAESAAGTPGEQVAFLNAINEQEIQAAKDANDRKVPPEVKQFAEMMPAQHQQNLADTKAVSKRADIKAEESDAVKSFKKDGKEKLATLKKLDDAQFAQTYAREMVAGHEEALRKLD